MRQREPPRSDTRGGPYGGYGRSPFGGGGLEVVRVSPNPRAGGGREVPADCLARNDRQLDEQVMPRRPRQLFRAAVY